jgi:hypothetical protein
MIAFLSVIVVVLALSLLNRWYWHSQLLQTLMLIFAVVVCLGITMVAP